jgi:hypothetical protein
VISRSAAFSTNRCTNPTSLRQRSHASATVVECSVPIVVALEQQRLVLAREHVANPEPLDVGQMSNEAEKRHVRRFHRSASKTPGVETVALELDRESIVTQVADQCRALVGKILPREDRPLA